MLIIDAVDRDLIMLVARGEANNTQLGEFRKIARVEPTRSLIAERMREYMGGPRVKVEMANRLQRAVHEAQQEMLLPGAQRGIAGSQIPFAGQGMPADQGEGTRIGSARGAAAPNPGRNGNPASGIQSGTATPNAGGGESPARGSQHGAGAPNAGRGGSPARANQRGRGASNPGRGGSPASGGQHGAGAPNAGRGGRLARATRRGGGATNPGQGGTATPANSPEGSSPNPRLGERAATANRHAGVATNTRQETRTVMGVQQRPSSERLGPTRAVVAEMTGGLANISLSPRTPIGSGRRGATGAPDAVGAAGASSVPGAAPGSQLAPADRPVVRNPLPGDSSTESLRGRDESWVFLETS